MACESGYQPPIPADLKKRYETALSQVFRWENGTFISKKPESDLDHVNGMLEVLEEFQMARPYLMAEFDISTVQHMIYVHDGGEILTSDLSHTNPHWAQLRDRWKHRERAAFRLLTRDHISDPNLRRAARTVYQRYTTKNPLDKETQITDLIDKIQGIRFGRKHVFHGSRQTKAEREMLDNNFDHSMSLVATPSRNLAVIVSPLARTELRSLISHELNSYTQFSSQAPKAEEYKKNLDFFFKLD